MNPAVKTSVPSQKFWLHQRKTEREGDREREEILTGTEGKQTDRQTDTHTGVTDTKRMPREPDRKTERYHTSRERLS